MMEIPVCSDTEWEKPPWVEGVWNIQEWVWLGERF